MHAAMDMQTGDSTAGREPAEEQQSLIGRNAGHQRILHIGEEAWNRPIHARFPLLWSSVFQIIVGIVLIMVFTSAIASAGVRHQPARSRGSKVSLNELATSVSEHSPPSGPSTTACRQGLQSFPIKAVLHNNLAGKGPDGGSEGLVFLVSQESHGVEVRDLKISLHALSRYHPAHPHWNGLEGEFASINQFGGRVLRVRIHVSDVADKPVRLDYLPIFICDLETDSVALREYVWAYGPHQAYWSPETEIGLDMRGNITEYWQQVVSAEHSGPDLGPDNPTYIRELTASQVRRTVTLVYRHVSEIELAFGSEAPADVTRTFFFAFVALDGCDMELVTSSTFTSTATQSTSTSTTPTTSSATRASSTLTTSTASTITSSYTTSTRTSATFTSTTATAVFGIPLFAPPGELHWWHGLRELSRLKRATLYSVALLGLVLLLVLYWLCWACRAREETGHEMRVLLRL